MLPLVDTDVWIDFLRGTPQAVAFVSKLPNDVAISSISVPSCMPVFGMAWKAKH
jgi:predicted nucleic acid-binding protein